MSNPAGFLPNESGEANAAALQKACDKGGEITIDLPGDYHIADTIYLKSDTSLTFSEGVRIIRENALT